MYITTVEIALDEPVTPSDAGALMEAIAPTYASLHGLHHKYFVLDEGGKVTGGVYVWDTSANADAWHDDAWHERVRDTYGSSPRLRGFSVPVEIADGDIRNLVATRSAE